MNRTRKKTGRACLSLLVIVMLMSVLCPAALADTDGTEPQLTQQPDQLILQLGTRWAGVEFELRTDAGVFPAPIVVDSSGVLTLFLTGLALAGAGLAALYIAKRRQQSVCDNWEDGDDDEY